MRSREMCLAVTLSVCGEPPYNLPSKGWRKHAPSRDSVPDPAILVTPPDPKRDVYDSKVQCSKVYTWVDSMRGSNLRHLAALQEFCCSVE
jgi:hypothetical protein